MLVPLGEEVAVPITVVIVGDVPDVRPGVLRRLLAEQVHVWLAEPLTEGQRVVLAVGDRTTLSGRVVSREGDVMVVSRDRVRATDDRAAPRVRGRAVTRWIVGDDPDGDWLAGGPGPDGFDALDGEVELSLSGMRIVVGRSLPVGTRVLVELELAGLGGGLRALGAVRRVDGGTSLAIEFLRLSEVAFDALSDFTLQHVGGSEDR
ncbi:MAG: PilZ domain-containing protein [Alphaproteobacteria bacterium]|nr:PilZ domain-containing protein [Alphaproteobacteria bacterium]MCB9698005.1 PilZ domain-containing protein [Alphaproteobacteria bacterium]